MISFEASNSTFYLLKENKSCSFSTPCHWNSEDGEEVNNKLNSLLELRSQIAIELHVQQIEKRGTRKKNRN